MILIKLIAIVLVTGSWIVMVPVLNHKPRGWQLLLAVIFSAILFGLYLGLSTIQVGRG